MKGPEAIPTEWIKRYVDTLLEFAAKDPESKMAQAAMLRADHTMDLVKAWREKNQRPVTG